MSRLAQTIAAGLVPKYCPSFQASWIGISVVAVELPNLLVAQKSCRGAELGLRLRWLEKEV